MKILTISHLYPNENNPNYGIWMARQVREMARQGEEITVIVPTVWVPPFLNKIKRWQGMENNVPVCKYKGVDAFAVPYLRVTGNWYYRWNGLAVYWALKKVALKLHREKKFDIIYSRSFFPDGDAAVRLAQDLKLPVVCEAIGRDVNIIPNYSKTIYNHFTSVVERLDGVMANGQGIADKLAKISKKPVLTVYGVVDLDLFKPVKEKDEIRKELGLPLDKKIVLYLSNLKSDKGVFELLKAFHKVSDDLDDLELRVCGSGAAKQGMVQYIDEHQLCEKIRMMGPVLHDQVHKWMKACDVFVLPSYHEGMPNAVMEAMACGLPVVATEVGGLPEAIGDSKGSILIPPRDVNALSQALNNVLSDDLKRQEMSDAARVRAEERFGVATTAKKIIDHFIKLIN